MLICVYVVLMSHTSLRQEMIVYAQEWDEDVERKEKNMSKSKKYEH